MGRYKRTGRAVLVRELPQSVQKALKQVGYGAKDIDVKPEETVSLMGVSGRGVQSFAIVINMATGKANVSWGSWGGRNPNEKKGVDWDDKSYRIPTGGAVILGSRGGGRRVFATVYVHPDTMAPLLPQASGATEREKDILDHFVSLKPSYRKEYMERMKPPVSPKELDDLVEKGFLKRNRAGATQITLNGKNALRESVSTLRSRGYLIEERVYRHFIFAKPEGAKRFMRTLKARGYRQAKGDFDLYSAKDVEVNWSVIPFAEGGILFDHAYDYGLVKMSLERPGKKNRRVLWVFEKGDMGDDIPDRGSKYR